MILIFFLLIINSVITINYDETMKEFIVKNDYKVTYKSDSTIFGKKRKKRSPILPSSYVIPKPMFYQIEPHPLPPLIIRPNIIGQPIGTPINVPNIPINVPNSIPIYVPPGNIYVKPVITVKMNETKEVEPPSLIESLLDRISKKNVSNEWSKRDESSWPNEDVTSERIRRNVTYEYTVNKKEPSWFESMVDKIGEKNQKLQEDEVPSLDFNKLNLLKTLTGNSFDLNSLSGIMNSLTESSTTESYENLKSQSRDDEVPSSSSTKQFISLNNNVKDNELTPLFDLSKLSFNSGLNGNAPLITIKSNVQKVIKINPHDIISKLFVSPCQTNNHLGLFGMTVHLGGNCKENQMGRSNINNKNEESVEEETTTEEESEEETETEAETGTGTEENEDEDTEVVTITTITTKNL